MTERYLNERQEMTSRLLAVVESMKVLGVSKLTLTEDGKVETETVKRETYFVSCSKEIRCTE